MQFQSARTLQAELHRSSGLQRAQAIRMTTVSLVQREYYRYTGISAELERRGVQSLPRPDFARLPRTTAAMKADSKNKETSQQNSALFHK